MASSQFERQVVEGDASDDRSPSAPQMADGPQQFEPSASFLDHDRPQVRLVELPAWLQSFAASVGEPSEDEAPMELSDDDVADEPVTSSSEKTEPNIAPGPKPAAQKLTGTGTDFISEDDLPEWLRSIVPEEPAESSFDSLMADRTADGEQITVPTITRAWSTSKDSRGVDEATTLFAMVASQTPQTAIPDQTDGGASSTTLPREQGRGQVAGYGTDRPPAEPSSIEMPTSMHDATGAEAGSKTQFPVLPIAVAAILILILVGAAAVMFVL